MMRKGDIVVNVNTSRENIYHHLMYLGKVGRCYECLDFEGRKIKLYCTNIRGEDTLTVVGHMNEYDTFVKALRLLKGR